MKLVAEDVRKQFGSVVALDELSVTVPQGVCFGILGANGAGKTTLFRLFMGFEQPDVGRIVVGDVNVSKAGSKIRRHIGYLPERVGFPPKLTGREVLALQMRLRGMSSGRRVDEVLDTVGLTGTDADRKVMTYSRGMRRRLGLAGAILAEPAVLILDEPAAGLDPRGVFEFHRIARRARRQTDATLLIASHMLWQVEELCDHVAVIDEGRAAVCGAVDELTKDDVAVELTFGGNEQSTMARERIEELGEVFVESPRRLRLRAGADRLPEIFGRLDGVAAPEDVAIKRSGLRELFRDSPSPGERYDY